MSDELVFFVECALYAVSQKEKIACLHFLDACFLQRASKHEKNSWHISNPHARNQLLHAFFENVPNGCDTVCFLWSLCIFRFVIIMSLLDERFAGGQKRVFTNVEARKTDYV